MVTAIIAIRIIAAKIPNNHQILKRNLGFLLLFSISISPFKNYLVNKLLYKNCYFDIFNTFFFLNSMFLSSSLYCAVLLLEIINW